MGGVDCFFLNGPDKSFNKQLLRLEPPLPLKWRATVAKPAFAGWASFGEGRICQGEPANSLAGHRAAEQLPQQGVSERD